jgi:hypothetical protein
MWDTGTDVVMGISPTVTLTTGTHPITLTVTDDEDASDTDTVSVTVESAPVADAGPDQTVDDTDGDGSEDITLDGSGSTDADGTIISYVWTENGTQIATGVSPTVNLAVGTYTITLTVEDEAGLTDTDTVTIIVNSPPTADAGADQTVVDSDGDGSEEVTLDGSGSSDSDGTIQSYSWDLGTEVAMGVSPTVSLTVGTHPITLTVTDDDGLTGTDTVTITVQSPPTADAGPDQRVTDSDRDGSEPVTLDGSGSTDPDGSVVSYTWSTGTQTATGVSPTITLTVGTHLIDLTVTDDDGLTDTDTVTITVNIAPVADAGLDETVIDSEGDGSEPVTLDGSGSIDPDGTIVNYTWSEAGSPIASGTSPTATAALTVGTHTITLTVEDNDGATDTDTVVVTVQSPPVADAGPDQTVDDTDDDGSEDVILDGSVSSDPDGTIVSYAWTENGTQIATGVSPTANLTVGTHTITLTVTDDDGLTDTDTVTIIVNSPPIADAGTDQTAVDSDRNGEEPVTLDGSGSSDPDGTIVSYAWTENGTQIATGVSPTANLTVGTHTITLTVTDDDGLTDTDMVTITVNPPDNQLPVADAGADQTVVDGDADGSKEVTLDGSGSSDPDGTIVSYVWTENGTQIATGISPTVNLTVGTHTITLSVEDDDGDTDTDTVTIVVNQGYIQYLPMIFKSGSP